MFGEFSVFFKLLFEMLPGMRRVSAFFIQRRWRVPARAGGRSVGVFMFFFRIEILPELLEISDACRK